MSLALDLDQDSTGGGDFEDEVAVVERGTADDFVRVVRAVLSHGAHAPVVQ